jgi:hypothetical protein
MRSVLIIILLLSFVGIGLFLQIGVDPAYLGQGQQYAFLLLLLLLYLLGSRIFLSIRQCLYFCIILTALFAGYLPFILIEKYNLIAHKKVGIAILADDKFGGKARAIKEEISHRGGHLTGIATINERIKDAGSAQRFLNDRSQLRSLIWGKSDRLIIENRIKKPGTVSTNRHLASPLGQMRIVEDIPRFILPVDSHLTSFKFFRYLRFGLDGIDKYNFHDHASRGQVSPVIDLLVAGQQGSTWSTRAHISYAIWQAGNYYLKQSFDSEESSLANLECALSLFRLASKLFSFTDNPFLAVGILNNYAVALSARAGWSTKPRQLKKARQSFNKAIQLLPKMRFKHSWLNSNKDRMFFGKIVVRNLNAIDEFEVWNKTTFIDRGSKYQTRRKK